MSARDCDRTRELLDGVPSTSEQQWLQAHARQCEHCRADVALAALLADAPAPAFTEHDELADRRLLDAVLDTARQQHDAAPLLQTPRSPRRAARVVLWAMSAAAVLAVAAGTLALLLSPLPGASP